MYYEKLDGISGFAYPMNIKTNDIFFLPIGCSWGRATWKRQWAIVTLETDYSLNELNSKNLVSQFDFGDYPFLRC